MIPKKSKVRNNAIFFPYLNDLGLIKHSYIGNAKTIVLNSKDLFNIQKPSVKKYFWLR